MASVTESLSPWVVAFTGVAIVFLVLIFLVIVISVFSAFGKRTAKRKAKAEAKAQKKASSAKAAPAVKAADEAPAAAPVPGKMVQTAVTMEIEDGITGDVVAAIAAAVTTVSEGRRLAIRSIRRDRSSRPAWASAGIMENTKPF